MKETSEVASDTAKLAKVSLTAVIISGESGST